MKFSLSSVLVLALASETTLASSWFGFSKAGESTVLQNALRMIVYSSYAQYLVVTAVVEGWNQMVLSVPWWAKLDLQSLQRFF